LISPLIFFTTISATSLVGARWPKRPVKSRRPQLGQVSSHTGPQPVKMVNNRIALALLFHDTLLFFVYSPQRAQSTGGRKIGMLE
jgi:hypothetical protein